MKLVQTNLKEKYNNNYYNYITKISKYYLLPYILENEYEFINFHYSRWLYYNNKVIKYLFEIGLMGNLFTYKKWKDMLENIKDIKKHLIPVINNVNIPKLSNSYFGLILNNNNILNKTMTKSKNIAFFFVITDLFINNDNNIDIPTYHEQFINDQYKSNTDVYYIKWIFYNYNKIIKKDNYYELDNELKYNNKYNKIYIRFTASYNLYHKDILYFGINILFLKNALEILNIGGDLIIRDTMPSHYCKIQLYYIITKYFESYRIINETKDLYINFILQNYKNKTDIFSDLFKQYEEIDNTLGKKYVNNYTANFDLNIEIDKKFLTIFNDLKSDQINELKLKKKKLNYITKKIKDNPKYIKKILNYNIYKSLSKAEELGLNINPYYKNDFFKLSDINKKKYFFPKANIDYSKLKYEYENTFSMTDEVTADIISNIIKLKYPNTRIIADMTANVGGNTLNFAKHFDKVYSIEINKNTFDILNNNIRVYGYKNIETFHDDANNFKRLADIYFYDPPWTGILYQSFKKLDLFLGNNNIIDMMKYNFILKAPINYNINNLLSKYNNISIYKLKNYLIIINNTNECKNCIRLDNLIKNI